MDLRRRGVAGAGVLLLTLMAGCAARPPQPLPAPDSLPSSAALQGEMKIRREAVHSLRALARLRYVTPEGSRSARQVLIVERPDRVRLEILSLLGTAFLLTSDGTSLLAWEPAEKRAWRGAPSARNLWRHTGIGLPVGELIDILLASPGEISPQASITFDPLRDAIRADEGGEDGRVLWFDGNRRLLAIEQHHLGSPLWQASYEGWTSSPKGNLPTRIRLELPLESRSVQVDFSETEINPSLAPGLFALNVPPGCRVVDLDERED